MVQESLEVLAIQRRPEALACPAGQQHLAAQEDLEVRVRPVAPAFPAVQPHLEAPVAQSGSTKSPFRC